MDLLNLLWRSPCGTQEIQHAHLCLESEVHLLKWFEFSTILNKVVFLAGEWSYCRSGRWPHVLVTWLR